jgi:Ca-activated chloride channel family protein
VRAVTFASPWFLATLLVVPVLLVAALLFERRRARYTVAFTNLDLLAQIAPRPRRFRHYLPLALFLLALAAASVALARPRAQVSVPSDRATVVLVVDVSGSMRANDIRPTRLEAAAHAMSVFAAKVPKQVRLGLVSFSSDPNILVMPTTDRSQLQEGIDLLQPEGGTAIGDALFVAVQTVRASLGDAPRNKDGKVPGAIVLLSDGAQTRGSLTPLEGADKAKDAGIRVYTVALGTNHGTLDQGNFGFFGGFANRRFPVRPDPATLAAIAKDTDGTTFQAKSAASVDQIYRRLGASVAHHSVTREISSWFVGAAALLGLLALGAARLTAGRLP